jgi:hypothetical protein
VIFEQKQHMKFKEPTKGKGIRTLFRKNDYQLYLGWEFRTNCKCSHCDGGDFQKSIVRANLDLIKPVF